MEPQIFFLTLPSPTEGRTRFEGIETRSQLRSCNIRVQPKVGPDLRGLRLISLPQSSCFTKRTEGRTRFEGIETQPTLRHEASFLS